jgi:sporulation protein YlmC with PRC-barrel domain
VKNLMLSTAIVTALAGTAWAQTDTTTTETTTTTDQSMAAGGMGSELFRSGRAQGDILASDFIGMRIYASEAAVEGDAFEGVQNDWEDIGEINDVILSQDGSVQAVLVDMGGFLGIGERQVAVQMNSLRFVADNATADNADDFFLVMNANRAALEGAPQYDMLGNSNEMNTTGAVDNTAATTGTTAEGGLSDGTAAPAEGGLSDNTTALTGTGSDAGAMARAPINRDGYNAMEREVLTTDTLTGAAVYDATDERIGDISELVLTPEGQVSQAVLDVGGFLGIGTKTVALPIGDVDILQSQDGSEVRVYVPHTREQLESMPAARAPPDCASARRAEGPFRRLGRQPHGVDQRAQRGAAIVTTSPM